MGLLNASQRETYWSTDYFFTTSYSAFVQDDWKVTSHLTLNLGFRYELPLNLTEKYGRLTNFIPSLNKLVISSTEREAPGVTLNPSQVETAQQAGLTASLMQTDYKDFAPRFGFAYRPFGGIKTVVRGGYGIFYGGIGTTINMYTSAAVIFPFSITQTISHTAVPTYLTLSNPFPVNPNLAGATTSVAAFQTPVLIAYGGEPSKYAMDALSVPPALSRQELFQIAGS
jgi:outer membrane receptor protein involved in Fe transport